MNILLIQPPHHYGVRSRPPAHFPIGLAQIAATLEQHGHNVTVLDAWAEQLDTMQVKGRIKHTDFDAVGISALCTQYKYVKYLSKLLAEYEKPIILGNALGTFSYKPVLENTKIDYCIIGEGEATMLDLLDNLGLPHKVKGLAYMGMHGIRLTEPRPPADINDLPLPAWDMFPIDKYLSLCHLRDSPRLRAMSVVTGRGCPYSCTFCSKTLAGARLRSIDSIEREITALKAKYGIKGVFFTDELVIVNKTRALELCDAMERTGLKWQCQGRVNTVDYDILRRMKQSGCIAIGYGVETGSQRLLNGMNKQATTEQAEAAIKGAYKAGILPIIQLMFGFPGENAESVNATINLLKRAKGHYFGSVFIATPLPGSKLYDDCLEMGMITDEAEYLGKLAAGYTGEREPLFNFTEFTNDEFMERKRAMEREIWRNSKRSHPVMYVRHLISDSLAYKDQYGWGKLLNRAVRGATA